MRIKLWSAAFGGILALSNLAPAQDAPPTNIDLSTFPAAAVQEVVVPVPSEIFNVLDKLGTPNWHAEFRPTLGRNTGSRPQVALLLGTVIADGFIAVEAQDVPRVEDVGRQVLKLSQAINVEAAVKERCNAIVDQAKKGNWPAVRKELDGALSKVREAMTELNDEDLAQLVSLGGWLRGTEVLTSIVIKDYRADAAELLYQPELLNYFIRRIDQMPSRLRKEDLVSQIRKTLDRIRPLIGKQDGSNIPLKNVERIHQMTQESVNEITAEQN